MKRDIQEQVNHDCFVEYERMIEQFDRFGYHSHPVKLRSCNARVYELPSYYVLESYNTIVAFIDKNTDTLYDVLRMVYGYTSTSAQHISKFEKDYCNGKWNCAERFTYRDI